MSPHISIRCNKWWLIAIAFLVSAQVLAEPAPLRACADPNNLPFSNQQQQGFENKILTLIAHDLNRPLTYTWWAQRRGFIRNTLNANLCDVIPGIAVGVERVATTEPYYRSSYVFVTRSDRNLDIHSFDDERLRPLTIGVQMIGDDFSNTPPAHALSRRGMIDNVRGFTLYGDYSIDSPPHTIIDAVVNRDVDVAVVWGPLAGYFGSRASAPLTLTPVADPFAAPGMPLTFAIAMGVRTSDLKLKGELEAALQRHRDEIAEILRQYGVPTATHEDAGLSP